MTAAASRITSEDAKRISDDRLATYGVLAARKYVAAYARQGGKRTSERCDLSFAETMLKLYWQQAVIVGLKSPLKIDTGNESRDLLVFASALLSERQRFSILPRIKRAIIL